MGDSPPPCPIWDEKAIQQLDKLMKSKYQLVWLKGLTEYDSTWETLNISNLKRTLGEKDRHCIALDDWIEDNGW